MNTAVDVASAVVAPLGRYLRVNRSAGMREQSIHDGIAAAFGEIGIEAVREYRLTEASRLDFWLPELGFAVEVKKGAAKLACLRQVGRYLEHPKVQGCLVIATRCHKLPTEFLGKPILTVELWRMLL